MAQAVLASDLGGTHLRAAMVDHAGNVSHRSECPTPARASAEVLIATIAELLLAVVG